MKKQMKDTQNEIFREPTGTGREPGRKSMIWNKRKKEASIQKKKEKQESKEMKRDLGTSGTT